MIAVFTIAMLLALLHFHVQQFARTWRYPAEWGEFFGTLTMLGIFVVAVLVLILYCPHYPWIEE